MYDQLARIIRERRTIRKYKEQCIPDELIYEMLNDAAWAPYHSPKEPWRFILFSDKGREAFAEAVLATYTEQELEQYGESARKDYCENAALHLVVIVKAESRPREAEDALLACAGFIQNLQLLAWNQGIGLVWKTNEYNEDSRFHSAIGLGPGERVAGTLHMGYYLPDQIPKPRSRQRVEQLTVWHKQ
jgi:nitroreductase